MSAIPVRYDRQRGCGWRKEGGLYLVAAGLSQPCGKLPLPLDVCPTCHAGIKPTRGWTWVDGEALTVPRICANALPGGSCQCPLAARLGRVGLLWIGEQFYPTPAHWIHEAQTQGVSRRISAVPKEFKVGETWVFVAHRKVIRQSDGTHTPGIFHAFKPHAVEYIVGGTESVEELDAMRKRGITPVRIERVEREPDLVLVGDSR